MAVLPRGGGFVRSVRGTLARRVGVGLLVATTVALAGGLPAGSQTPSPTVSVSPSSGLSDGQTITVTGAGFTPSATVGIAECRTGASSEADCDLGVSQVLSADPSGSFTTAFIAARLIRVGGVTIDCAQPAACVLGAGNLANLAGENAFAPIRFNATPPRYYLALGDSVPLFPNPTKGYAALLVAHYRQQVPGLTLVNIACSGETTTSLLHTRTCNPASSQMEAAEAFLAAHRGQIELITIDIGGNDIEHCGLASPIQPSCVDQALDVIDTNLHTILGRLRNAAGAEVPIAAMNYYDPFLIYWLDPAEQARAPQSLDLLAVLNDHLAADYTAFDIAVADVAEAFHSFDFSHLVASLWGTIPINVASACSWLLVTCRVGGPEGFADDPNETGSQVIATAFEQVINLTRTPSPPPPPAPAPTRRPAPAPPAVALPAAPPFTG